MATLLIFILLIITLFVFIFRHGKIGNIHLIITAVLFFMIGTGFFSSYLLNNLESYPLLDHPNWKKHNAIILLGAGVVKPAENTVIPTTLAYSRIFEAARLYTLCKNTNAECKIIISGGDPISIGKSEAIVYQSALNAIGIKNSDIILESKSMNTYNNAEYTSHIFKTQKFDAIFLVTSGIHMKRALLYFSHFGVNAIPSVSDYIPPQLFIIPIGYNFAITDFVLHEYIGIIRFNIYNFFGLNASSTTPGSP